MEKSAIFSMWAPEGLPWSAWVKPVLFWKMGNEPGPLALPRLELTLDSVPKADGNTAIVVDLEGERSVQAGLALATRGYRPVPLFNALAHYENTRPYMVQFSFRTEQRVPVSVVDMEPIVKALYHGAEVLRAMALREDAPPAFLIHANRRKGGVVSVGQFDNRSLVMVTDFPLGGLLSERGVGRVLWITEKQSRPARDLENVLRHWREAGLELEVLALRPAGMMVQPLLLRKQSWWSRCWFACVVAQETRRNASGEFGRLVQSSG